VVEVLATIHQNYRRRTTHLAFWSARKQAHVLSSFGATEAPELELLLEKLLHNHDLPNMYTWFCTWSSDVLFCISFAALARDQ
jgi:hypothetical protein